MSKKSARSKGYRKTVEKKPYMTKKEITITIVAAVVIIAAFIGMNFIPDGSVKIVDGSAKVQGENSVLAGTYTNAGTKYFKLGQMHEFDGYEMTAVNTNTVVDNVNSFSYKPVDAENAIDDISSCGYILSAEVDQYAAYAQSAMAAVGEGLECGELESYKNDLGKKVYYYTYTIDDAAVDAANATEQTAEEEAVEEEVAVEETVEEVVEEEVVEEEAAVEETVEEEITHNFHQRVSGYIDLGDARAIYVSVSNDADSTDEYIGEDELIDTFKAFVSTITYEKK